MDINQKITYNGVDALHVKAIADSTQIEAEMERFYDKDTLAEYRKAHFSERKLSKFFRQTHGNWYTMGCAKADKGSLTYLMCLHLRLEKADNLKLSCRKVLDALIRN